MLRKIILHFFLLFLLAFDKSILAFDPFINYPSNPLPFNNSLSGWNETRAYQPTVLYEAGMYKMWYASYNNQNFKTAYATSSDGISWTRQNLLDLFPGFDNHDPSILKTNEGYSLFFTASTNGGSQNFKIYKISSNDGLNFDPNSRQLILQPSNSLESNAVSSPFVFLENDTYYLFYLCWGSQGFRICMATSTDGTQWQRCANNPIITEQSDGPSLLKKDNKYYLFFQSTSGIRMAESSSALTCSMSWSNFQTVLPVSNIGPFVLENQNQLRLYYTGFSPSVFKINLATSGIQSSPTPTLTLTLTPTPTPPKKKIVIVPGTFASWNRDAMLHNMPVTQDEWKLLKFIKEYNGLFETLENLHYQKNFDYYVFTYDWRKKIEDIADDLKQYLEANNLTNKNISLVGHSLGGLVSRFFAQKYGVLNIEKVITVGSPHLGTANTYNLVEAGKLDRENTAAWLLQKLYIQSHRKKFDTDKAVIESLIPVSKDLFPIYDFLIDQENNPISITDMQIKNLNLLAYSQDFPDIFPVLTTLSGIKGNTTLGGFVIEQRNTLDILLNNYPDGRPTVNIVELGDNIVTKNSSTAGSDKTFLIADHGELIYKKESISNILDKLSISHNQNQLEEGEETKISPSLIFALFSPATMKVTFGSNEYLEEDGLVFIEDAQVGNYELNVKGEFPGGKYSVLIGQISTTQDKWFEFKGEINSILPFLQTDTYSITFNPADLLDNPVNQYDLLSLFDLLIKQLTLLQEDFKNKHLQNTINKTLHAKKEYIKENYRSTLTHLREVEHELFKSSVDADTLSKNTLFRNLLLVENIYELVASSQSILPPRQNVVKKLARLQRDNQLLAEDLLMQKNSNLNVESKVADLVLMSEKLRRAEEELAENNLALAEILLLSAENLSHKIK